MKTLQENLQKLADQYSLKVKEETIGFELVLGGGTETFEIMHEGEEFILMADNWHQHFDSVEALNELLNQLFKGEAWVVLKQTGHLLDGYKLMKKDGDSEVILRETGMPNPPSMRPKRLVKIDYTGGKRASHRME